MLALYQSTSHLSTLTLCISYLTTPTLSIYLTLTYTHTRSIYLRLTYAHTLSIYLTLIYTNSINISHTYIHSQIYLTLTFIHSINLSHTHTILSLSHWRRIQFIKRSSSLASFRTSELFFFFTYGGWGGGFSISASSGISRLPLRECKRFVYSCSKWFCCQWLVRKAAGEPRRKKVLQGAHTFSKFLCSTLPAGKEFLVVAKK